MPAVKSFYSEHHGRELKLGRRRPIAHGPRLQLGNYLYKKLPPPPPSCDYRPKASTALAQMYLNDQLGDCVIAGIAHLVGVFGANAGEKPTIFSNAQIIALYSAIGGYVPGNASTDQGCDEQTALNYWHQHGAPIASSHTIAGSLSVDPTDSNEYRTALWLFENLFFGVELPDSWIKPSPGPGFVWRPGTPDPQNGHCFVGVGYDSTGIQISTWGMTGTITDKAIQKDDLRTAGGDLYTILSQDILQKAAQKAPSGFDWTQLIADFDAIGGNLPPAGTGPGPSVKGKKSKKKK
jgi:hypothetical protein